MHNTLRLMVTIYTVCLGNICRSPIAEAVLRQRLDEAGLSDQVEVQSAGTAGYHIGENADRRTNRVLADHGYELNHSAQKFSAQMLRNADLVVVMDSNNYEDVMSLASLTESTTTLSNEDKIKMFRSFEPDSFESGTDDLEVPDPWYGNMSDFEHVLAICEAATPQVVKYAQENLLD